MTYQCSYKSVLNVLKHLSFSLLAYLFIIGVAYYSMPTLSYGVVLFMGSGFMIDALVCINLYSEYWSENNNMLLSIDNNCYSITIENEGKSTTFTFSQIQNTTLILSWSFFRGDSTGAFAWEAFHYARISLDGGEQFIITSLLHSDLRKLLNDIHLTYDKERQYYPGIKH